MRAMKTTGILVASGHPGLEARLRAECGPGLRTVPAWADLAQPAPAGGERLFLGVALPGLPEPEGIPAAWWDRWRGGVVWSDGAAAGNWRQVLAGRPQWEVWTDRLDPGRLWAWCRAAGEGEETPGLRPRRWGVLGAGADARPVGLFLAVAARAAAAYGPGLVVDAEWGIGDLTAALPGGERWVAPAALAALVRRRLPGVLGQAIRSPSVLDPDPPLPAPAAWQEVLAAADPWQGLVPGAGSPAAAGAAGAGTPGSGAAGAGHRDRPCACPAPGGGPASGGAPPGNGRRGAGRERQCGGGMAAAHRPRVVEPARGGRSCRRLARRLRSGGLRAAERAPC
ncbi:protein of unknown function [Candidatus Hydrogenisulfobacillus filiaventi]|uniref:Uncharacterized protein n=1 Tax=Candidatus Hydrogenisulfobacillus filiaventi TaxID=2707344 RepID=A0A6F8ZHV3_9FIRM|nr:protein of unknown function [Candidatus Hydrogenisulfobacillus filiaventi]